MIDYEKVLNDAQLQAVMTIDGPVLVIAGAGSGKTRTLVYRVARLVELGISPSSILLLTFTRKAAQQMLERASNLQDERCKFVSGGTFHSLANKILKRYSAVVGFEKGFSLLDRGDTEDIIHNIIQELRLAKEKRFPKKGTIANIISKSANIQKPIEEVMKKEYEHLLEFSPHIKKIFHMYQDYKRKNSLLDYDDLLLYLRELLQNNPDIKSMLSRQFRYIMVDEYQDTNKIQADILKELCFEHNNIMAVGDDSQAIYSFRGADFNNMFEFPKSFPGTKIIKLEQNYRSTQPILDLTNAIMEKAVKKYTKCLYTNRKDGKKPELVNTRTEPKQAKFVCQFIKEQLRKGYSLRDIAVLFRAAYHSFELEAELTREKIPYVKYGGFKFLESAHIKDFLSYIRAFLNKEDIISWMRILRLVKNIGPSKAEKIFTWIKENDVHPKDILKWPGLKKTEKEGLERLAKLFHDISQEGLSPADVVRLIMDYYFPIMQEKFDDYPKRKRELEQLVPMASRYKSLRSFVEDLILEPPTSPDELQQNKKDDFLTLSTVHSAKGLEWPIVIIIWASEGRFPLARATDVESLEEERRLMYVAATRAKDQLIICYPGEEFIPSWESGVNYMSRDNLSSFIRGIPSHLYNYRDLSERSKKKKKGKISFFTPGDTVQHPAFGTGVISRVIAEDKVEVIFNSAGKKLLHLAYTTLDKI